MKQYPSRWAVLYRQYLAAEALPKSWQWILLTLMLLGVLLIRLLTISTPALDRTVWKEIDYLAISTNYWKHGFHFLQPELSWPAEPMRVTEMELPVVPFVTALFYQVAGFSVYSARAITLLSFLVLGVYVFRLVKRETGPLVGLVAALAALVMPLYHTHGHFLFSEPLLIAASTVSIFHFAEWVDFRRRRDWVLAMLSFSLAVSLKPDTLYLLIPLLWVVYRRYRWQVKGYRSLLILVLCALVVPLLWYGYAYYLESNSVHQVGIFSGHNRFQTMTMLSDPGWYRSMASRIGNQILGGWIGAAFCLAGLFVALWLRKGGLFFAYLCAIGAFFVIVAEGQIDAPYRQLTIIPPLSFFVALGAMAVVVTGIAFATTVRDRLAPPRLRMRLCVLASLLLICLIPLPRYHQIISLFNLRAAYPERWYFSQQIKPFLGSGAKLAVAGEYTVHVGGNDLSPVLFHYLDVQGWNLQPEEWNLETIEAVIKKGATHFAAVPIYGALVPRPIPGEEDRMRFVSEMKAHYQTLYENGDWLLLDLRQPIQRP